MSDAIEITGKTYHVRFELKALGAVWSKRRRAWLVTPDMEKAARALVANSTGVDVFRFSSGHTAIRNKAGRCIDAPCCGCCTI